MKYSATEFKNYLLSVEDTGFEPHGWDNAKANAYGALQEWIESAVDGVSSLSELELKLHTAFDVIDGFVKRVYGDADVISTDHFDIVFEKKQILADGVEAGVFDKVISAGEKAVVRKYGEQPYRGVFGFFVSRLVYDNDKTIEADMIRLCSSLVERRKKLGLK